VGELQRRAHVGHEQRAADVRVELVEQPPLGEPLEQAADDREEQIGGRDRLGDIE
jgi:hypothetical protein